MNKAALKTQYNQLKENLLQHNYNYHVLDDPIISDGEYDKLFRELQSFETQYPELITPDSPTQQVGYAPLDEFQSFDHLQPMLSLSNVFNETEFSEFHERILKRLVHEKNVDYICEPKLDGTAKGGVLVPIAQQLSIPISYIGVGEQKEDLLDFNADKFSKALLDIN